jgi:hypothetical protein
MIKSEIALLVADAAQEARDQGELPSVALPEIGSSIRSARAVASSLALQWRRPMDGSLASNIERLKRHEAISEVTIITDSSTA